MKPLLDAGIMLPDKPGIDTIDAALCALVALHLATGTIKQYGDLESGLIVVPNPPLISSL